MSSMVVTSICPQAVSPIPALYSCTHTMYTTIHTHIHKSKNPYTNVSIDTCAEDIATVMTIVIILAC